MHELNINAVPLVEGVSLIEASAGTGKTFSIANLFLRMILERGFHVRNILVVTFTDAAVEELKTRIRSNINDALDYAETGKIESGKEVLKSILDKYIPANPDSVKNSLRTAIVHFDEAAIFTIHSFCKRTLQENSFESMSLFNFELITDQEKLLIETVDDFWRSRIIFANPLLSALATNSGISILYLTNFSRNILNRAGITFMPSEVEFNHELIISLYKKMSAEWNSSRESIASLINERVSSKELSVKALISKSEKELTFSDPPTGEVFGLIQKLSVNSLKSLMLKKAKFPPPEHPLFHLCEEFTGIQRLFAIHLKLDFADYLRNELKNKKVLRNEQSFDDLLNDLLSIVKTPEGMPLIKTVRSKFKAVMIDEFQDTDSVQYEIFRKLFFNDHTILFFIGDPKQSIYEFRGADIFSYIKAATETSEENKFTLSRNWRSESGMVNAVNKIFETVQNPFIIEDKIKYIPSSAVESSKGNINSLKTDDENQANLFIYTIKDHEKNQKNPLSKETAEDKSIEFTVNEISKLLDMSAKGNAFLGHKPVQPSDIAILVVTHNQATDMKTALDKITVPAVIQKSGSVFETEEAIELKKFMSAVETPKNTSIVNAALSSFMTGCDGNEIRCFIENEKYFQEYEKHLENFSTYHEIWSSGNFMAMFRRFMNDYHLKSRMLQFPEGDRRLTNILHLAELIQTHESRNRTGINGTLSWFRDKMSDPGPDEEHEQRLEKDGKAVQIMTVFKSKGLEYPIVFCPFMWYKSSDIQKTECNVYHYEGKAFLNLLEYDELQDKNIAESIFEENMSSFMRLFYVALTRSKNRCYICAGKIGRNSVNIFDYILSSPSTTGKISALLKDFHNSTDSEDFINSFHRKLGIFPEISIIEDEEHQATPALKWQNEENTEGLSARKFSSRIKSSHIITSFSNMTSSAGHDMETSHENDETSEAVIETDEIDQAEIEGTFLDFPSGPIPGSCLHKMLESADFSAMDFTSLIKENLDLFGIYENDISKNNSAYVTAVNKMLNSLMIASLHDGEKVFSLDQINSSDRISELEFYYPTKQIDSKLLSDSFKVMDDFSKTSSSFPEKIGRLDLKPLAGFVHGFMDLVFRYDGKFYIVDWKSNKLGQTFNDYRHEKIRESMESSFYILQYYIYVCALNKYLSRRIADYSYDKYFGGVFYIYLRGICPEIKGNGIFFDKPEYSSIKSLSDLFGI